MLTGCTEEEGEGEGDVSDSNGPSGTLKSNMKYRYLEQENKRQLKRK